MNETIPPSMDQLIGLKVVHKTETHVLLSQEVQNRRAGTHMTRAIVLWAPKELLFALPARTGTGTS